MRAWYCDKHDYSGEKECENQCECCKESEIHGDGIDDVRLTREIQKDLRFMKELKERLQDV